MEKAKIGFKTRIKNFFANLKERFKAFFNKEYLSYSFHKYKAFTALQLKEVFGKDKESTNKVRDKIFAIVFPIIKFVVVFVISIAIFILNNLFGIIQPISIFNFFVFFTAVILLLQLLASINSCTKSYYIAEDNKVLITFPSSGASLFLSKLTVEFIKELKSSLPFYIPFVMGMLFRVSTAGGLAPFPLVSVFWCIFPIILMCAFVTLLGSLLSVLYLQYLRLVKSFPIIRVFVLAILFGFAVYLAVTVINLIPPDIELRLMWNTMRASIDGFLKSFEKAAVPISYFCSIVCGIPGMSYRGYKLKAVCFGRFFILLLILIALFIIVFIVIKKLFLHMMTKSVDYEKVKENIHHKNHVHRQRTTFAFKEFKIQTRTLDISGTYIVTYVLIPVLILLLCKIFDAINTSMKGNMLSVMFIMLLVVLPLLASNSPLSSAYSREGHAGYIKKTKPIEPYIPMISKLLFNLALSLPSIFASMFIVGKFGKIDTASVILLGFSVLFLQYGHIFFSSTLDFTKPKNENYQTEGQGAKNPNENTSTVVAFVIAFIFAFLVFFFFNEQVKAKDATFVKSALKLFFVSFVVLASNVTLYFLKLKAFFMER